MNPRKILVIDDEVSFTRLIKLNLERIGGFEVRTENKSRDAVETARSYRPDLVVLDIIMPEVDGGEVASRFQKVAELKDMPILFLTATVKKQEVEHQKGMIGGFPFIAKPVAVDELIRRIQSMLSANQTGP